MAGLEGYMKQKHSQPVGRENVAHVAPHLQQRRATVDRNSVKFPVQGNTIIRPSIPASGFQSRDVSRSPARAHPPATIQQGNGQHANFTQSRVQTNGQGQTYLTPDKSMWQESTLGTESEGTVREESLHSHDVLGFEVNQGQEGYEVFATGDQEADEGFVSFAGDEQRMGQDDQSSDDEEEEDEEDMYPQDSHHRRQPNHVDGFPVTSNSNIPMRGHSYTSRFKGEHRQQRQQSQDKCGMTENDKPTSDELDQHSDQEQEARHLRHQQPDIHNSSKNSDIFAASDMDEDTVQSMADNAHQVHANGAGANRSQTGRPSAKRSYVQIPEIDFSQDKLFQMSYEELSNQPFENNPNLTNPGETRQVMTPPETLEERLKQHKAKSKEEQDIFFASLPIDEWERAGDWFLKQFGEAMAKIAEARRERRNIAADFEKQLAARDAIVRSKTDDLNAELHNMKNGGENLLRGKTPT